MTFLESSTIHGFKYLSKKYHVIERIFWTISLIFSGVCACLLISELVVKILNVPIITQSTKPPINRSDLVYPAVTVCSGLVSQIYNTTLLISGHPNQYGMYEPKTLKSHIFDLFDVRLIPAVVDSVIVGNLTYYELLLKVDRDEVRIQDLNERILRRLQFVDLVTRHGTFDRKNISIPTDNFLYTGNEFGKFAITWQASMNFIWNHKRDQLMSEILTEHGFCFTFNLAKPEMIYDVEVVHSDFIHDYFTLRVYPETNIKTVIPRTGDSSLELDFFVQALEGFYDTIINSIYDGHFVYIHDPFELPMKSLHPFPMHRYKHMNLFVESRLIVIDESLYDIEPTERSCFMEDEKKLKLFKAYTKVNCEHECLTDYMVSRCGCVEFFMIRNYTTRICSANEKRCFDAVRNDFEQRKSECGCLLPCNYIKYDVLYRPYDVLPSKNLHFQKDMNLMSYNRVHLTDPRNYYLIRKKQFNEIDFLSFVGGLLGLFAGFSVVSFIEVIYWMFKYLKTLIIPRRTSSVYPEIREVIPANPRLEDEENKINLFQEYFSESSIHGFKYILITNRLEALFWIFACIFSISFCVTLISMTNQKLPDHRIVSLDENLWKETSKKVRGSSLYTEVPFPSVTYKPALFINKMLDIKFNTAIDTNELYAELTRDPKMHEKIIEYLTTVQSITLGIINIVKRLGMDMSPRLDKMIRNSSLADNFSKQYATLNSKYAVTLAEHQLLSQMGYSFNTMEQVQLFRIEEIGNMSKYTRNISMANPEGYKTIHNELYPITMKANDKMFEYQLKLQQNLERNYKDEELMIGQQAGINILEVASVPNFMYLASNIEIKFGYVIIADVTPEIIVTDEDLSRLSPETRQCYFDDERSLKYFKIYTEKNCHLECLSDIVYDNCGCTLIFFLFLHRTDMHYCYKLSELKCAYDHYRRMNNYIENICHCLPKCNSVSYKTEYRSFINSESEEETVVKVRMKTEDAILYRRYQQYTFSDIVSYVGGLLGLFAGISMLSLAEILYFFLFRLIVNLWRSFNA